MKYIKISQKKIPEDNFHKLKCLLKIAIVLKTRTKVINKNVIKSESKKATQTLHSIKVVLDEDVKIGS